MNPTQNDADDVTIALKLAYYPDNNLARPVRPVEEHDMEHIPYVAELMFKTMILHGGIGLAANQCRMPLRMFVMRTANNRKAYINPKLLLPDVRDKPVEDEERCLSFPGLAVKVARYPKVAVEAISVFGDRFIDYLEGLEARVAQHEIEHLDGRTFIDDRSRIKKLMAARSVKKALKDDRWQDPSLLKRL